MACLEYDVAMISRAIREYNPDIVLTFHDVFSNKEFCPLRARFANQVESEIKMINPGIRYHSFETKQRDFQSCAKSIETFIDLLNQLFDSPEIFICISAGTNEFAAAAAMSSFVHLNVTLFSVPEKSSLITPKEIENIMVVSGTPVGRSIEFEEPSALETIKTNPPDKPLVLGLRILNEQISSGQPLMAKDMVQIFIEKGIWQRDGASSHDNVIYLRDFVDKWIENGWVVRGQLRNQYRITSKGHMILDTFYNAAEYSF